MVALLASPYVIVCTLAFRRGVKFESNGVEVLFKLVQAMANVVLLVVIAHERKFGVVSHPLPFRIYWSLSFLLVCLFSATVLVYFRNVDQDLNEDEIFSLASFPLYNILFIVSINGSTGIRMNVEENIDNLSGYATTFLIPRAMWNWMNPIRKKGYKSPLQMDDVPFLPPDHQAKKMA